MFEKQNVLFKIGINRIDLNFENDNQTNLDVFCELLSAISFAMPETFSRCAINLNYDYEDSNGLMLKRLTSKENIILNDGEVLEYYLRKNYKSSIFGKDINNIITIQNTQMLNKHDFSIKNFLSVLIDVNNTPIDIDSVFPPISKSDIKPFFEKLLLLSYNDRDRIEEILSE